MTSWRDEYIAALNERDVREKGNSAIIDAYSKLADHVAELRTAAAIGAPPPPASETPLPTARSPRPGTPLKGSAPPTGCGENDSASRLRADLQAAQRTRQTLQSQLATSTSTTSSLRSQLAAQTAQVAGLTRARDLLEKKIRDRDEELKGKGKLASEAQDEMVAMHLQLNVVEKQNEDLKAENQMLVKRWMDEMGKRAEKMNMDSKWE